MMTNTIWALSHCLMVFVVCNAENSAHFVVSNSLESCSDGCIRVNLTCNHHVFTKANTVDAVKQMKIECRQNVARSKGTEPSFVVGNDVENGNCYGLDQDTARSYCHTVPVNPMERRICLCEQATGAYSRGPRCSPGWNDINGACFRPFHSSSFVKFFAAVSKCIEYGGQLAAITDRPMLDQIISELKVYLEHDVGDCGLIGVCHHYASFTDGQHYPYMFTLKPDSIGDLAHKLLLIGVISGSTAADRLFIFDQTWSARPLCSRKRQKFHSCQSEWNYYKDWCYHIGPSRVNRATAVQFCSSSDSTLVRIQSKQEFDFIARLIVAYYIDQGWTFPTAGWTESNSMVHIDGKFYNPSGSAAYIDPRFQHEAIPTSLFANSPYNQPCYTLKCGSAAGFYRLNSMAYLASRKSFLCRKELNSETVQYASQKHGTLFESYPHVRTTSITEGGIITIPRVSTLVACELQCFGINRLYDYFPNCDTQNGTSMEKSYRISQCRQVNFMEAEKVCELVITGLDLLHNIETPWINSRKIA